jgi:hypothetical protein
MGEGKENQGMSMTNRDDKMREARDAMIDKIERALNALRALQQPRNAQSVIDEEIALAREELIAAGLDLQQDADSKPRKGAFPSAGSIMRVRDSARHLRSLREPPTAEEVIAEVREWTATFYKEGISIHQLEDILSALSKRIEEGRA